MSSSSEDELPPFYRSVASHRKRRLNVIHDSESEPDDDVEETPLVDPQPVGTGVDPETGLLPLLAG